MKTKIPLILVIILIISVNLFAQSEQKKGKTPVIIIPGILGSKLVNKETNEIAWVKFSEAKSDNLKLPISPDLLSNQDNLVATDVVDRIRIVNFLPGVSVYEGLLYYLDKKAGYHRGNWDDPLSDDDQDTYYVFPYDWRRDNVETAHLLIQKIEKLKAKLKKPDLKFDVIAHSMGGLVARYAAMYGTANLTDKPHPTWAGAKYFDKIFMLGTPNEGSMGAFESIYHGYWVETIGGRYYPEFLNREVGFTIPALFQLLPHGKTAKFYGEDLKPLDIDIYDVKTWKKYGWTVTSDEKYMTKLSKSERSQAEKYFEVVLRRTRNFHEALDVKTVVPDSLTFYAYGSDCKSTLDGAIIYFDAEEGKWETLTQSRSFKNIRGEKITDKMIRQIIFAKGDGSVTKTSLLAENLSRLNGQNLFLIDSLVSSQKIVCENHTTMPGNKTLQDSFMTVLSSAVADNKSNPND